MQSYKCLIIIPAFNEEDSVSATIAEIRSAGIRHDMAIIDDGSTDQTVAKVRATGETVLSLPLNLGYAGAIQTGFKIAADRGYDYVVQFDADGQHDPRDIQPIIDAMQSLGYDVVIGSRVLGRGAEDLSISKRLVIGMFRWLIKLSTKQVITDPTSGLRGLSRRAFVHYSRMGNYPEDYDDANTVLHMLRSGLKVTELPANIRRRMAGKSMFSGWKGLYYVAKMIIGVLVVLLSKRREVENSEDSHFDVWTNSVHYGFPPSGYR